ncbi:MAG: CapA family protein [Bacteroidales bacterium]|nr:CapA family protein [Bacteroidales bacterium]
MKAKFDHISSFLLQLSFVLIVWIMLGSIYMLKEAERQEKERLELEAYRADSLVTLLFAGDVMGHKQQFEVAYDRATGQYDYSDCFRYVEPYIESVDFACANLEVTLGGAPYSGYPCFSSPDALLFEVQNVGFDLLFTANNHVLDRGKLGVERTIMMLDSVGMPHAGSYVDSISRDTSYPLIMAVRGLKVGFINATYGTNGIREKAPNVVNRLDTAQMARDLERLVEMGADLKVAVLHWGNEYELKGNKSQLRCAQSLANHGADLIIGGHPHVVQNADTIYAPSGKPVVLYYSMGNFISNQQRLETKGGIMVRVTVNRFTGRVVATEYIPYFVYVGTIHGKYQYYVVPCVPYLNGECDFSLPKYDSTLLHAEYNAISGRLSNFTQSME